MGVIAACLRYFEISQEAKQQYFLYRGLLKFLAIHHFSLSFISLELHIRSNQLTF